MIGLLLVASLIPFSLGGLSENSLKRAIRDTGYDIMHNAIDPGKGYFQNCGTAKNFSFTWSPKELYTGGSLTVDISFVSPYDWRKSLVIMELSLQEIMDKPVFQYNQEFTCDQLKEKVSHFNCPFKANELVHLFHSQALIVAQVAPPGAYGIKIRILNENNEEILCGKANLNFDL